MPSRLNVLSLTAGDALLEKRNDGAYNQQQLRQMEYAKHLNRYIIIARTIGKKLDPVSLAPNLIIYPTNSKSRLSSLRDMTKLASGICTEQHIDVISPRDPYFFGRIGMKLKHKHNIPVAVHVMGDMINNRYFFKERFGNRILNYIAKRILSKADSIRVSTTREREKLIRLGLPQEKIFRVPFFVDLKPFVNADGSAERRALLQDKYDRIVLTVSRLSKEKNVAMLVRVAARVAKKNNRILFVVIGDGRLKDKLKNLAASLGAADNILFTGRIENALLPEYYHAADAFAITSFYEGTCMVLLEAAVSGLPVVSTDTAGAADAVVKGKTGYILPVDADEEFALIMLDLLNNTQRKEMGAMGRRHILENFDKNTIIRNCITMWEYAASKKSEKRI
jgi:glycosyltransferase involved in cell wall biosynthesis